MQYSGLSDLSESSSSYKSINIQLRRFHKLLQQEIHEKSQLNAGREIISTVKDLRALAQKHNIGFSEDTFQI